MIRFFLVTLVLILIVSCSDDGSGFLSPECVDDEIVYDKGIILIEQFYLDGEDNLELFRQTDYEYDSSKKLVATHLDEFDWNGEVHYEEDSVFHYDSNGFVELHQIEIDWHGADEWDPDSYVHIEEYHYSRDEQGRVTGVEKYADLSGKMTLAETYYYEYGDNGRTSFYNEIGPYHAYDIRFNYSYDDNNRLSLEEKALWNPDEQDYYDLPFIYTEYIYDEKGRLVQAVRTEEDEITALSEYIYDGASWNITEILYGLDPYQHTYSTYERGESTITVTRPGDSVAVCHFSDEGTSQSRSYRSPSPPYLWQISTYGTGLINTCEDL